MGKKCHKYATNMPQIWVHIYMGLLGFGLAWAKKDGYWMNSRLGKKKMGVG